MLRLTRKLRADAQGARRARLPSKRRARMTETLRVWWDAQKTRANYGEFAGAIVRVGIGFILLFAYYAWVDWGEQTWGGYLCWASLLISWLFFPWLFN